MSLKEIEKLREKIQKDPNSKLYVPLAEEYRKIGMLDEAIEVLQSCIEKQPSYMSARVSLGRIYLEKDRTDDARIEFEQVINAIPDNLYAHKKLSEIYRDSGKKDLAIKVLRSLMKLNPMDEEALVSLRNLETDREETPVTESAAPDPVKPAVRDERAFGDINFNENSSHDNPVLAPSETGAGFADFKGSLFGSKDELLEETDSGADESSEGEEPAEEAVGNWSFGDIEDDTVKEAEEKDTLNPAGKSDEADQEWPVGEIEGEAPAEIEAEGTSGSADMHEETAIEWPFGETENDLAPEITEPDAGNTAGSVSKEKFDRVITSDAGLGCSLNKTELLETAEKFISEGEYAAAVTVYRQIISVHPDDNQTLQRMEDLRFLLKLMGRDKEILISNLSVFLNAIQKRGDELSRRS